NLSAGQRAKSSTAHETALGYLNAGLSLVTDELWDSDYDLAFALRLEAAECQYRCGNFDAAEQQFALLLQRAATRLDSAKVYRLHRRRRGPGAPDLRHDGAPLAGSRQLGRVRLRLCHACDHRRAGAWGLRVGVRIRPVGAACE